MLKREISSNALTRLPTCSRKRPSSAIAAAGSGTAANAVTEVRGIGNSLSTAPVITPSVPSEPMNNCFRS